MSIINLILAASNLYGLKPMYKSLVFGRYWEALFISTAMLASTLMHISETKHDLPGMFLVEYSYQLLWFDRIVAYSSALYLLNRFHLISNCLLFKILIALFINLVSEMSKNQITFMIYHLVWHLMAYQIWYELIRKTVA